MRMLANENLPRVAVEALRRLGHDVLWARTDAPGRPDAELLAQAVTEGRVLLTFDKDFGERACRHGLSAACGIVLRRIAPPASASAAERVAAVLASRSDWAGHFSIIEEDRIRMRPLPGGG